MKLKDLMFVIVLFLTLFSGCKKKVEEGAEAATRPADTVQYVNVKPTGTTDSVKMATGMVPVSMAPVGTSQGGVNETRYLLYETLVHFPNSKGGADNFLAKEIKSLGNGVYDVTIYDYITDSRGNNLTADDVVYCFDTATTAGFQAVLLASLKEYEKTGDYTVRFYFENEKKGNATNVFADVYMYTRAGMEQSRDKMVLDPIGTGAYVIKNYITGASVTFARREDYWQKDASKLCDKQWANAKEITHVIISDYSTACIALQAGDVDTAMTLNGLDYDQFYNDDLTPAKGYNTIATINPVMISMYFNCGENSPLKDINLRKAIMHGIDRKAITQNVRGRWAGAATDIVNPAWPDIDPKYLKNDDHFYPYDVAKAKEYLARSSYKGETLKMLINPTAHQNDASILIQAYCDAIGVKLELLNYDTTTRGTMILDESGTLFDIDFVYLQSALGFYAAYNQLDGNAYKSGIPHIYKKDDTLQSLYDTAGSVNSTMEDNTRLIDYVNEQCYVYPVYYLINARVGSDKFTNIAYWGGSSLFLLGACSYAY
jgi:ABC-type transport system substrate-binding protein